MAPALTVLSVLGGDKFRICKPDLNYPGCRSSHVHNYAATGTSPGEKTYIQFDTNRINRILQRKLAPLGSRFVQLAVRTLAN